MPVGYCTGISQPAKGTILRPAERSVVLDAVASLVPELVAGHEWFFPLTVCPLTVASLRCIAFCTCSRFSAWSHTFDRGPSSHLLRHLLAPVRRQAVQEDGARVGGFIRAASTM